MGEFVVIALVLLLVIGATFLVALVRKGNTQRVVKDVDDEDRVERIKIKLTDQKAEWLRSQLVDLDKKVHPVVIDFYEDDERLVRITVNK
jgi:uncharacterized protein YxeA